MNERQRKLLEFLHAREWVSPETIFEAIPEYDGFNKAGYQSAAKKRLSYDVRALNNDPDVPLVICSTRQGGYKIGTKDEAWEYAERREIEAVQILNRARRVKWKLMKNNQMKYAEDGEISRVVAVLEEDEK